MIIIGALVGILFILNLLFKCVLYIEASYCINANTLLEEFASRNEKHALMFGK